MLEHGGMSGYVLWVQKALEVLPTGADKPYGHKSVAFLNRTINGRATAPMQTVLALTRLASGEIEMSDAEAKDRSADYFEKKEV